MSKQERDEKQKDGKREEGKREEGNLDPALLKEEEGYRGSIPVHELLRALWPYLRPYRARLAAILALAVALALLAPLLPYVSRCAVDGTLPHARLALAGLLVFFLVMTLVVYYRAYAPIDVGEGMAFGLRLALYRHLQRLTPAFYQKRSSGEIVSRLTRDIGMIMPFAAWGIDFVAMGVLFVPILVRVFTISARLAALSLTVPALLGVVIWVLLPRVRRRALGVRARMGALSGEATEGVQGMKVVQSFAREEHLARQFRASAGDYCDHSRGFHRLNALFHALISRTHPVGALVVLIYAVGALRSGELTQGQVLEFIMLLGMLYWPIMHLAQISTNVFQGFGSLERIVEFFRARPEVADAPDAVELSDPAGRVEFRGVSFAYASGGVRAVRDVSFTAEPGTVTALVGPSGSGKSTLMDLLSRFNDPDAGGVLVDGADVRRYTLRSLRRHIGTVMQEAILFSGSIRENLRLGRPEATGDQMREALRLASALEFVEAVPGALDGRVGERGVTLSGGERQRLAIARAFLKNPKILVLDEATSALDSESEKLIQQALARLMQDRTTFVIAHRLSTVLGADQVLVIEDGRIAEHGRPAELLERHGRYAQLFEEQFREAAEALAAADSGAAAGAAAAAG